MNLSLGEFRALIAKACRGAGYPWGLTEDAGHAARLLAELGYDSGEMVARLLTHVDGREVASLMPDLNEGTAVDGAIVCPICLGATLADRGIDVETTVDAVMEPALLAPFLLTVDGGYRLSWDSGSCRVGGGSIEVEGGAVDGVVAVTITPDATPPEATTDRHDRVELNDSTRVVLERFAHRTYAPATEASRIAGAGAGLNDND